MGPQPVETFTGKWLTRPEVQSALGASDSTLERMVKDGRLRSETREHPGRKWIRVYAAEDVERLKVLKDRQAATPSAREIARPKTSSELALAIREAAAQFHRPAPLALKEKLWLSIDEAVEYSGLAKIDVVRLCRLTFVEQAKCRAERLPGRLVVRRSGGWKIQRASLEAFAG